MRDLVQTAVARLKPGETYGEIKWDEIIEICIERNSFESLIDARTEYVTETDETGHESKIPRYKLTQASNKRFSFLLNSTYGGKTFKLNDGRTVKWDSRGKKRSKNIRFKYPDDDKKSGIISRASMTTARLTNPAKRA